MDLPVVGYVALSRLIAGAVALLFVVFVLPRLFRRKQDPSYLVRARCGQCGWSGQVSQYAAKCPKCGAKILI